MAEEAKRKPAGIGGLANIIKASAKRKKRVPFRLSEGVRQRLLNAIVNGGYGLKGKSRFVEEAINELLATSHWVAFTMDSEMGGQPNTEMEDVYLPVELVNAMESKGLLLRAAGLREEPPVVFRSVVAPIARAAILRKIGA